MSRLWNMSELGMHAMCEIYPHVYVVGVYVYFIYKWFVILLELILQTHFFQLLLVMIWCQKMQTVSAYFSHVCDLFWAATYTFREIHYLRISNIWTNDLTIVVK